MCTRLSLSLLILLLCVSAAHAQLVVIDPSNLAQNTITAVESVLTTIEETIQTAQGVLNLTLLESIISTGGILEDIALLGQLLEEASQISQDLNSLQAQINSLMHWETAPDTRDGLAALLIEFKRLKQDLYTYAARVQTLMRTAITTVRHMQLLLETLAQLVGNLQGQQVVAQHAAAMHKHLANLSVQQGAYYQAKSLDQLMEGVTIESIRKIQAQRLADWPSF
jgi:conjugal transfer/entry exclusion protein